MTLFGLFVGGAVMEWLLTGKAARVGETEKVVLADRFDAREFRVVDEGGVKRASMSMLKGFPQIDVRDENGTVRLSMVLFEGAPSVVVNDENMRARALLGCTQLANKRTESVEQRQASSLVLFKSDGDVLWQAP